MKFYLLTISVALLSTLGSCTQQEENCIELKEANIVKVEGKQLAKPGEDVLMTMTISYTNGCGSFAYLEESTKGRIKTITATGKYEGCSCTMALVEGQTGYLFKTRAKGLWTLKFKNGNEEVVHEIVVE